MTPTRRSAVRAGENALNQSNDGQSAWWSFSIHWQPMRLGHRLVSDFALADVDAAGERGIFLAGFLDAEVRQHFEVAISHIGQCLRRGARVGAGHVRDAIV